MQACWIASWTILSRHRSHEIKAAGLPAEEKPKLCDDAYEKELEDVGEIA